MQSETNFSEKVLSDFDRYSSFIALDVNSKEYQGQVVIENDDLYYFFEQTQKVTKVQYKLKMVEYLKSEKQLDIQEENLERWNFIKVTSVKSVQKNAEKGTENFIATYFDGIVLKDGITDEERVAIINQLFEWEIASNIDDETGYLVINK